MTTRLKLWRGDEGAPQGEEPRTLRFPVEAVSAMPAPGAGRSRTSPVGRVRPSVGPGGRGGDDLVQRIEETLDRVQSKFDDLKGQLAESHRLSFPRRPDGPRSAA